MAFEYLLILTWETTSSPLMAHHCDCYFEAGKRECEGIEKNGNFKLFVFYLQHSIIKTYIMKVKDTLLCTLI